MVDDEDELFFQEGAVGAAFVEFEFQGQGMLTLGIGNPGNGPGILIVGEFHIIKTAVRNIERTRIKDI